MRPRRLAVALAALALLAACSTGPATTSDRSPASGATGTTEAPDVTEATTVITVTTTSGIEPRRDTPVTTTTTPVECTGPAVAPVTYQYLDVDGGDPQLVNLDVYRPSDAPACPVAIWVHGGGWMKGDKRGQAIDTKVAYFASLGYVLVSVNYRLAAASNDIRWPVYGTDVAAAVAWTLDHAGELGVDRDRVVLVGHSAGAHLVSIVATHPTLLLDAGLDRTAIGCVVALDTASYDLAERPGDDRLVEFAFGTDPAVLDDASPTVQVIEHGGPLPDFLVVARGTPARIAAAEEFASSAEAAGARVEVIDASPYTHGDVNVEFGAPGETVLTPAATEFLAGCR
jgi:acetyl esterase/lipase